jgi:hypothetical protein
MKCHGRNAYNKHTFRDAYHKQAFLAPATEVLSSVCSLPLRGRKRRGISPSDYSVGGSVAGGLIASEIFARSPPSAGAASGSSFFFLPFAFASFLAPASFLAGFFFAVFLGFSAPSAVSSFSAGGCLAAWSMKRWRLYRLSACSPLRFFAAMF